MTFLRVFAVCGRTPNFLWLLAERILISLRLELLADKVQFDFFSPLACSCGARTSCATSCMCIIFGLYCIYFLHHFTVLVFFFFSTDQRSQVFPSLSTLFQVLHSRRLKQPKQPAFPHTPYSKMAATQDGLCRVARKRGIEGHEHKGLCPVLRV